MKNRANIDKVSETTNYFSSQLDVLELLIKDKKFTRISKINKLFPLFYGVLTSGKSVVVTIHSRYASESFVMARCFLERAINLLYLINSDEKQIDNYINHGIQKGFILTNTRHELFNTLNPSYLFEIYKANDAMNNKIKNFTKKGRPLNWTELSFNKRVEIIKANCSTYQYELYKLIYKEGSESSHGSFYGNLIHTGILSNVSCQTEGLLYLNSYLSTAIYNLADLVTILFQFIEKSTDYDISDYLDKLTMNSKSLTASLGFTENLNDEGVPSS